MHFKLYKSKTSLKCQLSAALSLPQAVLIQLIQWRFISAAIKYDS